MKTPGHGADRWAAGNMADVLLGRGDYADAITHFRGEIGRDRAETMPYLAAVHEIMGDQNPAQAAKFATQMQKAGLAAEAEAEAGKKPEAPVPAAETSKGENGGSAGQDSADKGGGANGSAGQQLADVEDWALPLLVGSGLLVGGAIGQQGKPKPTGGQDTSQPQLSPTYPNNPPVPPQTGTPPSTQQKPPPNVPGRPAEQPQGPNVYEIRDVKPPINHDNGEGPHSDTQAAIDKIPDPKVRDTIGKVVLGSGSTNGADEKATNVEVPGDYNAVLKDQAAIAKGMGIDPASARPIDPNDPQQGKMITSNDGRVRVIARPTSSGRKPTLEVHIKGDTGQQPYRIKRRYTK